MEIIAEIGQNHNGDMRLALELINAAKENGADVAKFQIYDASKLFPKENNKWYEYNCKTELSRDQVELLANECKKVDIEFMASAFDEKRVSWLNEVEVRRFKIASRSIFDKDLINRIISTGKPIIVSLGNWFEKDFPCFGENVDVGFLYCISKYPTPLKDLELSKIDFKKFIGFSDHSVGLTAAFAAFSLGAQIIEKHFTINRNMYGPDHRGSMTPNELQQLNQFRNELTQCL